MQKRLNVLAISYGRTLFSAENTERKRMERCAQSTESFHMIIFTLRTDSLVHVKTNTGLVLHPTNSKTKLHMLFDAIRIGRKILQYEKPWVITAQDPFETGLVGYVLSRMSKWPLNVQEHGDFYSRSYWRKDLWSNRLRYVVGKFILRRADTVRVVSKRIKNALIKLGAKKENILYLPVRSDVTQNISAATDLHQQYPEASTIILSMGRLVRQKNLPLLLHAFAKLQSVDSNTLLLVVGSGSEESALKKLTYKLGISKNVVYISWTDNPQSLMESADIFALSSAWEGWGRVLIEAMIAGTPVITTDVGCAGEVLIHDVNGHVVDVDDCEMYTKKLIQLVSDKELQERYSTQAKQDVKAIHISEDEYVLQWRNIFEQTYSRDIS